MQRFVDQAQEVRAVGGQVGGSDFAGEGGEDVGIDDSGEVAGEPLREGADEGGKAGVVRWFRVASAHQLDRWCRFAVGGPFDAAEGAAVVGGLDFDGEGGGGVR